MIDKADLKNADVRDQKLSLWGVVSVLPLLTILLSFILQKWGWGLMDDLQILTSGLNVTDRFLNYFRSLINWGVFRPVFAAHSALVYTFFENNPNMFYIFKFLETCLTMAIWGSIAYRITKQRISFVLLPVITLSFHYFYDAFFYLSSQETLGLLFLGLALYFFLYGLEYGFGKPRQKAFPWPATILAVFFLLCAFGSKETFISGGIALGISFFVGAYQCRKVKAFRALLTSAILVSVVTAVYLFLLLTFIKSGYSSGYSLTDTLKLKGNLLAWFWKDFANHSPWLLGAIVILFIANRSTGIKRYLLSLSPLVKWSLSAGLFLYFFFLAFLLPWNTICYYAGPLGIFFALIITVIISESLLRLRPGFHVFVVTCALILSQLVCSYALVREATYQYDTDNLIQWFKQNNLKFADKDQIIFCNAMEASFALPGHINRKWDLNLEGFQWSLEPNKTVAGRQSDYYIYSPRFQKAAKGSLKDWEVAFLSKNWIVYKRTD